MISVNHEVSSQAAGLAAFLATGSHCNVYIYASSQSCKWWHTHCPTLSVTCIGWCVQSCQHIFMHRKWEDDEKEMSTKLHYFNAINYPVQLLLFPGGRDLTEKSKARSDSFAEANGLPKYDYVLHPHTKGFVFAVAALKKVRLDSIVDITVGYPDQIPLTEVHFLLGTIPREVHYYVERFAIEDLPETEKGLEEWCREQWRVKEERLRYFYEHRHFPSAEPSTNHRTGTMSISNGHGASNGAASISATTAKLGCFGSYASLRMLYALGVQALIIVSNCYMLYHYFYYTLLLCLIGITWNMYHTHWGQGLDGYEIAVHRDAIDRAKDVKSPISSTEQSGEL